MSIQELLAITSGSETPSGPDRTRSGTCWILQQVRTEARGSMTKPRRLVKRPRQSANLCKEATKPPAISDGGKGAEEPSSRSKPGLSPEAWETVAKVLPGIIKAVAVLIDAISKLR
jgi:hypothetical protein